MPGRFRAHDGNLDPAEAQAAWDRSKDPARAARKRSPSCEIHKMKPEPQRPVGAGDRQQSALALFPSGFGGQSYTEVKTRRESVRLMRDQVQRERLLGELVDYPRCIRFFGT